MALNQCTFMGNLTRDPERKQLPSGLALANFTVAVNQSTKRANKSTLFLPVSAYGAQAENVCKFFRKGRPIIVSGRLECDLIEDAGHPGEKKQIYWLNLTAFEFVDGGRGDNAQAPSNANPMPQAIEDRADDSLITDDDLPF